MADERQRHKGYDPQFVLHLLEALARSPEEFENVLRQAIRRLEIRARAKGLREAAGHAERQTAPGYESDFRLGMPANIARAIRERAAALEKEADPDA